MPASSWKGAFLGVGALAAIFAGPQLAAAASTTETTTVIEHAISDTTTDIGAAGDSVGDLLTFSNPVFDAGDRTRRGTSQGYCVRVVVRTSYECTWTTILSGGRLVVQGPFYDARGSTLAITGGMGKYRRARGTMTLRALAGGKKYRFTFRISR